MRIEKPVWVWLPQSVSPVLAGLFSLDEGRGRFCYDKAYLSMLESLPLDPLSLPLSRRNMVEIHHGGIFGILRDSGPDSWGRQVLQKAHGRELSDLELLEFAPGDNVGAIAVGDPGAKQGWKPWTLDDLVTAVDEWDKLQIRPHDIARFLSPDTGLGGAKPKTTVEFQGELWLAKRLERGDSPWSAFFEDAALRMAKNCGQIDVCETRVEVLAQDKPILLVKRFDRVASDQGYSRKGYASADTALRLGDKGIGEPGRTYVALGQELRRWCAKSGSDAKDQVRELWRRIAFNGMVGNMDDHPKNHGLIQEGKHWKLSPAFDIVPCPLASEQFGLSMPFYLDGNVRSSAFRYDHLIGSAIDFGYGREDAVRTLRDMAEQIMDTWAHYLGDVPQQEKDRISSAFIMADRMRLEAGAELKTGILPERKRGRGMGRGR